MSRVTRFLKRPATVVVELVLLTATLVLSTIIPSADGESGAAGAWAAADSLPARVGRQLGLDHLFTSPLFLALVTLALASLMIVLRDQTSRAWRLWRRAPGTAGGVGAPFRREATIAGVAWPGLPSTETRTRGSAGVWGSPLFHLGILLVVVAGLLRMLFGAEAVVDLMVGETLLPRADQYGRQWPGVLARPVALPVPVRLEELHVTRYASGEMKWFEGTVRLGLGPGSEVRAIAVNGPLRLGSQTLYLRSVGGAAALVEVLREGRVLGRHAILLRGSAGRAFGQAALGDGTILRAATRAGALGRLPDRVDLRAMRWGALVAVESVGLREAMTLPGGHRVVLSAVVPWAQLSARRDVASPLVYLGFSCACLGGLLMVAVVRVDSGVRLEQADGGVRLTVWMRPYRFAPLFAPSFEALWHERRATLEAAAGKGPGERS